MTVRRTPMGTEVARNAAERLTCVFCEALGPDRCVAPGKCPCSDCAGRESQRSPGPESAGVHTGAGTGAKPDAIPGSGPDDAGDALR